MLNVILNEVFFPSFWNMTEVLISLQLSLSTVAVQKNRFRTWIRKAGCWISFFAFQLQHHTERQFNIFGLNDTISSCQKVGEAVRSLRFMLQQHFSNISNYKNPSKHETIPVLNNNNSNNFISLIHLLNVPTVNAKDYILYGKRQNTRFFFNPSKPWHKMHLNALPSVLHSSGMTNLSTV